ncbi:MAG TPA: glucuronate isomerase [Kiritimatiellia bacterium]|nr:glucuronate isomerase [Kiritimatiellia bacterium]
MKKKTVPHFITRDFLLESPLARKLYHDVAADLPIIDYHNHLPPREIAEDRRFENLAQIWLAGDHYKWRAMRTLGVPERFITGDASDREKFERWAACVPQTARNPLYHWTHMELLEPFGIRDLLNADTAARAWKTANAKLASPAFSVRGLLKRARVEVVCTTDDPTDDLRWHRAFAKEKSTFRMFPAFRPDAALWIDQPEAWNAWIDKLAAAAGIPVTGWATLLDALRRRRDFFHANGCRLADHGLEQMYADDCPPERADTLFRRARNGERLGAPDTRAFRSALLFELGLMYAERDWTQQFHLGALRNVNTRMQRALGRDAGYDVIGDFEQAIPLARALDRWDRENKLARTILYNLNPRDNEVLAAMCGAFQDGVTPGKIQFGSGWWFLDQLDGMEKQLEALSNLGLLGQFVGMLTDSRSFLSFSRHAYFRRLLCNLLAADVVRGRLPRDLDLLGGLVRGICHDNAARYFGFDKIQKKEKA